MEGGSLFNSGFLGASFNWWIGQIADDSTWRDNILPGKFEDGNAIPGWGYRYKVRIIGLHDQGENEIPSDRTSLGTSNVSNYCWRWSNIGKANSKSPSGK
jgi:hypothetical protein